MIHLEDDRITLTAIDAALTQQERPEPQPIHGESGSRSTRTFARCPSRLRKYQPRYVFHAAALAHPLTCPRFLLRNANSVSGLPRRQLEQILTSIEHIFYRTQASPASEKWDVPPSGSVLRCGLGRTVG